MTTMKSKGKKMPSVDVENPSHVKKVNTPDSVPACGCAIGDLSNVKPQPTKQQPKMEK